MLNSLIKGCAAAADVASAKKWYHRIYSEGLTPSILSFNSFLGACGTAGYEQEAESVLQDMLTAQLRPDGFSYLALIKAHGHKSAKEAERWFFRCPLRTRQCGHRYVQCSLLGDE